MQNADVLIIGGGAAGLMCAMTAAQRGKKVTVLEGSNKIGKKILMSGGGRCNFTNLHTTPANFVSANPHFCKSALSRYAPRDFIALVEKHEIPYHEKTLGQLFCDRSSKDIVAMLLDECNTAGVQIHTHCSETEVQPEFVVRCSQGAFRAGALVIASGGLSIPKMGASDFGYRVARQFGHEVLETRAGLVPFTFTGAIHDAFDRISGVSCNAIVSTNGHSFREDILFTHRGLSGPAALQISSHWQPGEEILVNLLPDDDAAALLIETKRAQQRALLRTVLCERLPRALVQELQGLVWPDASETPIGEMTDRQLTEIGATLNAWTLKPAATEGYRTAEVTLGGVSTDEISSQTMESKRAPGLYFIGEVVDVTGQLGGFNFQWAWASGHAAGLAA